MAIKDLITRRHKDAGVRRVEDPFEALQTSIDRLFDEFRRSGDFATLLPALDGDHDFLLPHVDVSEGDDAAEITAELPGIDEKDVEVVLRDDVLTIKGEKKGEKEEKRKDYHLVERSYGSFARSVRLPFEADSEAVKANFAKGVLKVSIAKPAEVKEKTVKIPVRST